MTIAISPNYSLAVNAESVWGTPVTSGAKYLRISGANLSTPIETIESDEISSVHRETADLVATKQRGGGTFEGPMIFEAWETLFASLCGAAPTGTTVRTQKIGKLLKPLTFQEAMSDITQFISYPGAIVTSFNLNVVNGQMIKCNWGFASKSGVAAGATAIGTVGAANTNRAMDPLSSIQVYNENGGAVAAPYSFSLSVTNDLIDVPSLLTQDPVALFAGRIKVTGSIALWKQDASMFGRYKAQTNTAIAITLGDVAEKNVAFTFDVSRLTTPQMPIQPSAAILETYGFTSLYDSTNTGMKIVSTD